MAYADDRYWIVYNGEIYNYLELRDELRAAGHRFRTRSDTEVLLAAWAQWGEAALDRLVGMFAFVLWDQEAQIVFAARDHFGVKPLYFFAAARRSRLCLRNQTVSRSAGIFCPPQHCPGL